MKMGKIGKLAEFLIVLFFLHSLHLNPRANVNKRLHAPPSPSLSLASILYFL